MDKPLELVPLKILPRDAEVFDRQRRMHMRIETIFGIPSHMVYVVGGNREVVALDTRTGTIHGPVKI